MQRAAACFCCRPSALLMVGLLFSFAVRYVVPSYYFFSLLANKSMRAFKYTDAERIAIKLVRGGLRVQSELSMKSRGCYVKGGFSGII